MFSVLWKSRFRQNFQPKSILLIISHPDEIIDCIVSLKNSKSSGHDFINTSLFKSITHLIAPVLQI